MNRRVYPLVGGGEVLLDWGTDVQAAILRWDGIRGHYTKVITTNGRVYFVKGEHGVRG